MHAPRQDDDEEEAAGADDDEEEVAGGADDDEEEAVDVDFGVDVSAFVLWRAWNWDWIGLA